jgi:tRNA dimethylallyltransferase
MEAIPIGTGQPDEGERQGVPHVGYGCLPLSTPMNPASFGEQVRGWMERHERVVLVTGSGLYLRGIWNQLDELPSVPSDVQARVRHWHGAVGAPRLHRYLAGVDPARAAELHPNDGARIQRAIALYLATGTRPSALFSGVRRELPEGWKALLVLPSRDHQRERVQHRVRAMVEAGWPEEVRALISAGHGEDLRRLRPLGYLDWLEGGDPAEIEARIARETQAYAKRQATWFRHQLPGLSIWDPDAENLAQALGKLDLTVSD